MTYVCRSLLVVIISVLAFSNARAGQVLTIPEAVERQGEDSYIAPGRIVDRYPMPFELAVQRADLIVHGLLRKIRTYLSEDQKTLYTDHLVVPVSFIASDGPALASRPGITSNLVLREYGGETTINGVYVKIYEENVPLLPTDVPLVLFLVFDEEIEKYEVLDTITGAFEVRSDGTLKHLLDRKVPSYDHINGKAIAEAIRQIREHRTASKR